MKKFLLMAAGVLLASCSTNFYQIYKTQSENGSASSFEDANCKITYNLWSDGGNAGFSFYNKTSEPITLNLDQSFFVLNGRAYDYFLSRTYTNSTVNSKTNGTSTYFYGLNLRQGVVSTSGTAVSYNENPSVIVPAHTTRMVSEYKINEKYFSSCDLSTYPTSKQVHTLTFEKSNSPFVFYNTITYTIGGKASMVNNDFYVLEITNYPDKDAYENRRVEECGKKRTVRVSKFENANSFYYLYVKKN